MVRSSFSQHNTFEHCARWWYLQKVKRIQVISDMCYALAGNVIHHVLEKWYNHQYTSVDNAKADFKKEWLEKKLDTTKLAMRENGYWLMCVEGFNKELSTTTLELKIFFPEIVAYLDVVDSNNDIIHDWKSSTRGPWNEKEYKQQLTLYAWLYQRKFNRIPNKCVVHYLKYPGSKGILEFTPTVEEIQDIEKWYMDILGKMTITRNAGKLPPKCEQCHIFCPYPEFCSNNTEEQSNFVIRIKNNIVYVEGIITPLLLAGLNKKFSYELQNAHWIKKARPNMSTTVRFWNSNYNCIAIGFLDGLKKTLSDYVKFKKINGKIVIIDERKFDETKVKMPDKFLNGKVLRDYQNEAVRSLFGKKIGIIESGTGSGKTEMAIECIRMLGVKTLFVVDKVELLKQSKQRIEESLGITVGVIGNGKCEIKDITVATIQSLIKKKKELGSYLNTVRFAIFDECHHASSKSYMQISRYLNNTEYRVGFSATSFRDDGHDMAITAVVGYKIFELGSRELIEKGYLMDPKIIFLKDFMKPEDEAECERKCKTDLINESESYSEYYNAFIVNNDKRNKLIKKIVDENPGKKILVLVKLIEHGEILSKMLDCKYLHGSINKDDRNDLMADFKNTSDLLVGTISIFGEGLDIPKLDIIINASANKGNVRTIQTLGRALRKLSGKTEAFYYDFLDYSNFFKSASNARRKILRKEGHEVLKKS